MEVEGQVTVDCPHCRKSFDTDVTVWFEPEDAWSV